MKRALIGSAVIGAAFGVAGVAVLAAFTQSGSGAPTVHATTMPTDTTAPMVSVSGRDVSVSWTQRTMGNGTAVAGYSVQRHPAAGGSAVAVGGGCSGTVATLSCTETSVTPGSWTYTVTPVQGSWTGSESSPSSTATVASPALMLSASVVAPSHAFTASISGFDDGDAVTFHLGSASGTAIGTATAASTGAGNGSGSGSVTIPAGTASNTYTIYAVGTDTATAPITVDATPPVVSASTIALTSSTTTFGYVAKGSQYYVYANASDSGGSNLAAVTADVHNVTSGQTAVTLSAGTYTVGVTTYGFRSAALTAGSSLTEGAKSYSVTATDGVGNSSGAVAGSVTVDNTAPAVSATVIAPTSGGTAGTINPGSTYYVYANASDASSGVASVTADVSNVTSGATSVSLVAGSYTVNSVTYGYRSASQTADSTLTTGSKSYSVSATDNVGNASAASAGSVTVAAPPPVIAAVALAHTTNTTQQGSLSSGAGYYVYADVTDSSGPGIGSVKVNVSSLGGGSAVTLSTTGGPFTAFGNTYNYRTAPQTAGTLTGTTLSYTVSATDTASTAATPVSGSVTVDNTKPTVSSISSTNNNGTLDIGDTFVVTFSKAIDPGTVNTTAGAATLTFDSGSSDTFMSITGLVANSDMGVAKGNWVANGQSVTYPGTLSLSNSNATVTFTVSGACATNCTKTAGDTVAGTLAYTPDTSSSKLTDYAGNTITSGTTNYPSTGTIKVF